MNHISKISAKLADYGLDAMLITSESGELYALGFHGEGMLLVTAEGGHYSTDGRYIEAAEEQVKGVEKKMYFITLVDRGVMRAGMKVFRGEEEIGYITSGTMVPYMTENGSVNRSIGIAYLKSDVQIGDEVQIDVRGKKLKAAIVTRHMKVDATHAIPVVYGE